MNEDKPILLTTLSASWGRQSTWLLWEMILGLRPVPENFVALTADPGMEKDRSYAYRRWMLDICRENGIEVRICEGKNLFRDLTEGVRETKVRARSAFNGNDVQWEAFLNQIAHVDRSVRRAFLIDSIGFVPRLDNPAYFLKKADGKRGKMSQKCTREYKITPMRQEIRRILFEKYGINPRGGIPGKVESWIGFATDEAHRVKESDRQYITLRYPLIEAGLDRPTIDNKYRDHGVPIPPPSVCNGCFAHGLAAFSVMHRDEPEDFAQAVEVDEEVRDMRLFGFTNPVYVSDTLIPLRQLAEMGFDLGDPWKNEEHSCSSGVCFI